MPNRRTPPPKFELNDFSGPFRNESARACAVLGGALLEERLTSLYCRRLKGDAPHRMLWSFAMRIQFARALAWIEEDVAFDLDKVREIRNAFAHLADHDLSFEEESIAAKCSLLRVAQTLLQAEERAVSQPHRKLSKNAIRAIADSVLRSPRQKFEITVEMIAQYLDDLHSHLPEYEGPNIVEELLALGQAFFDIRTTTTVTQDPVRPNRPSSE